MKYFHALYVLFMKSFYVENQNKSFPLKDVLRRVKSCLYVAYFHDSMFIIFVPRFRPALCTSLEMQVFSFQILTKEFDKRR